MPSGAKKRKAAKKKLHNNQPHHHNHTNNASYSQGSDSGDVERESAEEIGVKSYEGESNFAETAKEVNPPESHNGDASEEHKSSSSSSSSSSDDDEVHVKKDKLVVGEVGGDMVKSDDVVPDVGLGESGVGAEVVEETVDESIPVEETVKEVVSTDLVSDSVPAESSSVPDVVDSELNQSLNEVSLPSGEKENVAFEVTDLGQENSEGNEIPVVDNGLGNSSISTDNSARDGENKSGGDDHVKDSGTNKNTEEQPLISSTPLPVQRTSWMNCCGLFEVISGGSGR